MPTDPTELRRVLLEIVGAHTDVGAGTSSLSVAEADGRHLLSVHRLSEVTGRPEREIRRDVDAGTILAVPGGQGPLVRWPDVSPKPPSVRPGAALLTVEAAAEVMSIGRTAMYKLVQDGEVRSIKVGRSRRIPRTELDAFITRALEDEGI